jgi:hypothetical protein
MLIISNTTTASKAFFGVHNEPDLNGNRVRIHRSTDTSTNIHTETT